MSRSSTPCRRSSTTRARDEGLAARAGWTAHPSTIGNGTYSRRHHHRRADHRAGEQRACHVKRSPLPPRRTPLARGVKRLARRTRLRPVSQHRQREALGRAAVRAAVFERDGWRCWMAGRLFGSPASEREWWVPCHGGLTLHHLRKASQGGDYSAENGITLCVRHNEWVEEAPTVAHTLGLVVRRGEAAADAAEKRRVVGFGR